MENVMETTAAPAGRRGARRWLFGLGVLLLALASLALLYEMIMAADGGYRAIAAGELWFRLHPYSLNLSQAITQRYLAPNLWDPVMVSILQWPAWSILGAPGAILIALFRPWTRKRG